MNLPFQLAVSVIIPVFNAAGTIRQSIESVLAQNIHSLEILLIDDGSTDETAAILNDFINDKRIRVLRHPLGINRGVCASRRLALQEARGEFIAFLDADDYYLPGKLDKHLKILQERPEIILIHSAVKWKGPTPDHPGVALAFKLSEQARIYNLCSEPYYLNSNIICNSTVITRRAAIEWKAFPETMSYQSEDWVLWNMIAEQGLFYYDPDQLTEYTFHANSYTFQSLQRAQVEDLSFIEFYTVIISRLPKTWMQIRAARFLLYRLVSMCKERLGASSEDYTTVNFDSISRIMLLGFFAGGIKVLFRSIYFVRLVSGFFKKAPQAP